MLISTINAKGQVTIPAKIRKMLNLQAGDKLLFEIKNHKVFMSKMKALNAKYHEAVSTTLSEWNTSADDVYDLL